MNLLDNQEDLITFLGQHLKPKEIEKKQNGEVFTPPDIIHQMNAFQKSFLKYVKMFQSIRNDEYIHAPMTFWNASV